tara:strand:- start:29 stop:508 length:480 start_codon:yes stop_codon:yes gene_type:complete
MADLTVTLTESLTLNGKEQGGTYTTNLGGCTEAFKRLITCTASQTTTLLEFRTAVHTSGGAIDLEGTKYIRITNLDSTNPITLNLQISDDEDGAADDNASIVLEAGRHFILGDPHDGIAVDSTGVGPIATASLKDLESIIAIPDGNTVIVEVFTAGQIA